ncbi:MAG: hypothetical protein RMZ69_14570, partial [Nostoc sp. ChiQUE01a]|nr:hypothetical protein [Nostoc sp. ChiQUE01a]
ESPHVETRFIASDRPTRSQDAINRRLYRESTRQLFLDRLLFPTCVYTVTLRGGGWGWGTCISPDRKTRYDSQHFLLFIIEGQSPHACFH